MKRVAVAPTVALALLIVTTSAHADSTTPPTRASATSEDEPTTPKDHELASVEAAQRDPAFALLFALGGGVGLVGGVDAIDAAVVQAGRSPTETGVEPLVSVLLGGEVMGVSFGVNVARFVVTTDDPSSPTYDREWLSAEVGYDVLPSAVFTLGPSLALGRLRNVLCVTGAPGDTTRPGSLFQQVVSNPGQETCLEESGTMLQLGLRTGLGLRGPSDDGTAFAGALNLHTRVGWQLERGEYTSEDFAGVVGPTTHGPTATVTLELTLKLGGGTR